MRQAQVWDCRVLGVIIGNSKCTKCMVQNLNNALDACLKRKRSIKNVVSLGV